MMVRLIDASIDTSVVKIHYTHQTSNVTAIFGNWNLGILCCTLKECGANIRVNTWSYLHCRVRSFPVKKFNVFSRYWKRVFEQISDKNHFQFPMEFHVIDNHHILLILLQVNSPLTSRCDKFILICRSHWPKDTSFFLSHIVTSVKDISENFHQSLRNQRKKIKEISIFF